MCWNQLTCLAGELSLQINRVIVLWLSLAKVYNTHTHTGPWENKQNSRTFSNKHLLAIYTVLSRISRWIRCELRVIAVRPYRHGHFSMHAIENCSSHETRWISSISRWIYSPFSCTCNRIVDCLPVYISIWNTSFVAPLAAFLKMDNEVSCTFGVYECGEKICSSKGGQFPSILATSKIEQLRSY